MGRRAFSAEAVELALLDRPVAARPPTQAPLLPCLAAGRPLLPDVGSGKRPAGLYDALLKGVGP